VRSLVRLGAALGALPWCLIAADQIPVVFVPRDIPVEASRRLLGRGLESPSNQPPYGHATMREALGAPVVRIAIHQYPPAWGSFTVVAEYITRLLDAQPEGELRPTPIWSEGAIPQVFGTIEFGGGVSRPLQVARGYVFFQDVKGRSWCARYLGGDPKREVVPKIPSPQ
jgi:hypothetical protein